MEQWAAHCRQVAVVASVHAKRHATVSNPAPKHCRRSWTKSGCHAVTSTAIVGAPTAGQKAMPPRVAVTTCPGSVGARTGRSPSLSNRNAVLTASAVVGWCRNFYGDGVGTRIRTTGAYDERTDMTVPEHRHSCTHRKRYTAVFSR